MTSTAQRFPAREHARKVVAELLKEYSSDGKVRNPVFQLADTDRQEQAILLQGSPVLTRDDTDRELPFRQCSS
jgi:hypothetical protein